MDTALFRFINATIKNPVFDYILPVFSDKDYVVIPGLVAAGIALFMGGRRARVLVLALVLALLVSDWGSEKFLKNVVKRDRPYATLQNVNVFRSDEWQVYTPLVASFDRRKSFAFPSSHASNVAAVATVLAFASPATLWVTVPLALLVGLSRVYTGNHYPLDVLGGYGWGILSGLVVTLLLLRLFRWRWSKIPEPAPRPRLTPERKRFYWLLGAYTLMNFIFVHLPLFGLSGDEAQYWDWSRHLALGYYSKPPMIAYVMGILVGAGGNQEWSLRTGAVLFTSGTIALLYALTLRITRNERAAMLAALVAIALPFTWAGSVIMTIDPLLVFFWALALYAFHRAVNGDRGMWWLTGAALGFGMLSKYTMALLYVSFMLYLILFDRRWLRTRGPYLALILSLLMQSGVLYWNWAHDWVSFRHTANIGAPSHWTAGKAVGYFFEFLGGQLGAVSPILFVFLIWAMVVAARRLRGNRDAALLFLSFVVLFGFYAIVALTRRANINWPIAAYLGAAPALAWFWYERPRGNAARRWLVAGLVLGCVIGIGARSTDLLYVMGVPINPDADPTNALRGGRELGDALSKYVTKSKTGPFPFSDRYQLTAYEAYYTRGRPRAYCANIDDRRHNQYDMWDGWPKLVGRDGIFVTGGDEMRAVWLIADMVAKGEFESGEYLETVEVRRGNTVIRTYTLSRMHNYTGKPWKVAEEKF